MITNITNLSALNLSNLSVECTPLYEASLSAIDYPVVQTCILVAYILIMAISVSGNVLVLYVCICCNMSLNVRAVFIVSLAISDLLISVTSLPISAMAVLRRLWILPHWLCPVTPMLMGGGIFVSSFTLSVIAVDRFLLIVHPHISGFMTQGMAYVIVGCIWGTGEKWSNDALKIAYGVTVVFVQFSVPLVICCSCYFLISRQLTRQYERRHNTQLVLAQSEQRMLARRRRANRMMVSMLCSFVGAWLPLNMFNILRDSGYTVTTQWNAVVFACVHCCAMTTCVWNPIIYSWFNEPFRKSVLQMLPASWINCPCASTGTEGVPTRATQMDAPTMDGTRLNLLRTKRSNPNQLPPSLPNTRNGNTDDHLLQDMPLPPPNYEATQ